MHPSPPNRPVVRFIHGCLLAVAVWSIWTNAARADIGLSKDGVANGLGYTTDAVNLTLYGIWDAGVGSLEHSYSGSSVFASTINPFNLNSSPNRFNGLFSSGVSMSRVGVQGDKLLGGEIKVFFKLESAINSISGNLSNNGKSLYNDLDNLDAANGASAINGQPFSRAAYAGISESGLGSLEFGRTTNFSLDQVAEYDPVQAALLFSPLGFSGGIGGGLGATENTRLDHSLKYENTWNGMVFGVLYKFAGSKTDQEAESGAAAMLGYSKGPFSFKATYAETWNTVAYAAQYSDVVRPQNNLQIEDTRGYMVSGKYAATRDLTLKAGYESAAITAPSNPSLTSIVSYYGITFGGPATDGPGGEQYYGTFWAGGDYKVTSAFDVGVGYYDIDTHSTPENRKEYRTNAGSCLADYTFCKGLDAYLGVMIMEFSGIGLDKKLPTYIYPSNVFYGTGVRLKF